MAAYIILLYKTADSHAGFLKMTRARMKIIINPNKWKLNLTSPTLQSCVSLYTLFYVLTHIIVR